GALLLLVVERPPALDEDDFPEPRGLGATGPLGLVVAASGFSALVAQLAWLRLLEPLAGAHELGAALVLAPVLLGMALGAGLGGALFDRLAHPARHLPLLFLAAGVLVLLSLPLAGRLPLALLSGGSEGSGRVVALVQGFVLALVPSALCFGAVLPAAVRVRAGWVGTLAEPAGRLYGWNAVGALTGGLVAGFGLLPLLGAERALLAAGLLLLSIGCVARWRTREGRRLLALGLLVTPLLVLAWPGLLSRWLSSGPGLPEILAARRPLPPGLTLRDAEDLELYAYWFAARPATRLGDPEATPLPPFEGRLGRVALLEEPGGAVGIRRGALRESLFDPDDASRPAATEYALGLLPALLVPDARRALVIGHGAGWTAEAILAASNAELDVAETDRAVLDAARTWRSLERLPVEASPRAHLLPRDGRQVMARATGEARYDIIVSQPSHPWCRASGHLFTQEAFETAHAALTERGVLAQWLNVFDLTPDLLERALASFRHVFPQTWVFRFPGELVLVGFRGAPLMRTDLWEAFFHADNERNLAARRAGFAQPGELWKHFALDATSLARVLPEKTQPLRDDRPELELALAWRRLLGARAEDAQGLLLRGFPPAMETALPDAPVRDRWLTQAVNGWLDVGGVDEARLWCDKIRWGVQPAAALARARASLASGTPATAETNLRSALATWPTRGDVAAAWLNAAASVAPTAAEGDRQAILDRADTLTEERFPDDGQVLAASARLYRSVADANRAGALFARAVAAQDPGPPPGARVQLARLVLSQSGMPADEVQARDLLAADPHTYEDREALDLLMRLAGQGGDERSARQYEHTLGSLERAAGLAHLRAAHALLAAGQSLAALEEARAARVAWSEPGSVHELEALAMLTAMAAARAGGPPVLATPEDAYARLQESVQRSARPEAATARARRMLRWFDLAVPEFLSTPPRAHNDAR
ncbi:MAG: hypothetical protein O2894_11290, partial [Planctomycetota bacterium]|nr:hypothetical protein [Planctomycetota bacterium]